MVQNPPAMQEMWVRPLGRKIPWRRKWQLISIFLPGKSHGQRSLAGCSPWGRKELDVTRRLSMHACTHAGDMPWCFMANVASAVTDVHRPEGPRP